MGEVAFTELGVFMARICDRVAGVLGPYHRGSVSVGVDEPIGDGVVTTLGLRCSSRFRVSMIGIEDDDEVVLEVERHAVGAGERMVRSLRQAADEIERGIDEYKATHGG